MNPKQHAIHEKRIGVALSGGGYRATAFHVGTLRALHKLGVLEKIDVVSTISGGSITGTAYCLSKEGFDAFDASMLGAVSSKSVIRYVLTSWVMIRTFLFLLLFLVPIFWLQFSPWPWISILLGVAMITLIVLFQFRIFPVSKVIEKAYDQFYFQGKKLKDLPERPLLAIGSTNLQTCRPFTFSRRKMDDSSYAYYNPPIQFKHQEFPLSSAVMASTCVPAFFTPVSIGKEFFESPADLARAKPILVDGGIYDNQGIHKLTQPGSSYECECIIASDAGTRLPFEKSYNNTYTLLLRTVDTFMARIKNFQMARHIYLDADHRTKEVAYVSLPWDLASCIPGFINNLKAKNIPQKVIAAHKIPETWAENVDGHRAEIQRLIESNVGYSAILANDLSADQLKIARDVKTNLTRLSPEAAGYLARHAANMTELQVKLYCPTLLHSGE